MEKIKVVYVRPNKYPVVKEIDSDLHQMQALVGGYIECLYCFKDNALLVCNDEGKFNGMKPNRMVYNDDGHLVDVIHGPFFICGRKGEEFTGLTSEQQEHYFDMFLAPERLVMSNGKPSMEKEIVSMCAILEAWAKGEKRVTNRSIRNRFKTDEETADTFYTYLRSAKIIGRMGYVMSDITDNKEEE